jgi:NRAMP (natural resistance-associated macrophage protein)-like metal ion transporter
MDSENNLPQKKEKLFTLSEAKKEAGLSLVVMRKLVVMGEVEAQKAFDGTIRITESDVLRIKEIAKHPWGRARIFLKTLGPGLITGASDDDPGGIGTYSSVGAKFGFAIIWMALWLLPIMLAVQEVCARIGIVTEKGLAGVLQKHYRRKIVGTIVFLLIIANIINIGADLGAMAASLGLLLPVNFYVAAVIFAVIIIILEVFVSYRVYVKILKWLTVSLVAYIITGFIIKPDWMTILKNLFIPQIEFSQEYIFAMVAVFGTTITPYLFFWQTSGEVEEGKLIKNPLRKRLLHGRIRRMRTDVKTGMILANVVFFFIVITTAQVFHENGIYDIQSAEQAAMALQPLAGDAAFLLFAAGIIGTGMLAIPVLAGSGAYALSEVMKWKEGLELKFSKARNFYLVIAVSILVGLSLNFFGINPIAALYYSAFINGIIAVPLLITIFIVGNDKKIMGEETSSRWVNFFGWVGVVAMSAAILLMIYFQFFS